MGMELKERREEGVSKRKKQLRRKGEAYVKEKRGNMCHK